ncbi:MAG: phage tail sheath C-terminal domain-containing protein [Fluviicola sp.]|nr:phage tail sheath C-terminal domain-containing protein [Fluviicola sp.]
MASYKTPGVYVQEISKFPPSVAQVETAIPAFIGYTQMAKKKIAGDLASVPTRISSMLEYQTYFGSAEPETGISVSVSGQEILEVTQSTRSKYMMYYSLQLYFANGGGPCYIVSVGDYSTGTVTLPSLSAGLGEIRKYDEPTLLLFPDATSLSDGASFYGIYSDALMQCADLQDRFTIIDTYTDSDVITSVDELRNGISLQNDFLKYGAAYFPYLNTILDFVVDETAVVVTDDSSRDYEAEVQALADSIDTADLVTILTDLKQLAIDANAAAAPAALAMKPDIISKVNEINGYLNSVKSVLDNSIAIAKEAAANPLSPIDPTIVLANALDAWITMNIEVLIVALNSRIDELNAINSKSGMLEILTDTTNPAVDSVYENIGMDTGTVANTTLVQDIDDVVSTNELDALITGLAPLSSGGPTITNLAAVKVADNLLYNKIKTEISILPLKLPPSSAMAGIYARVDGLNGVWKAPANVGVTYVTSPSLIVTHEEQADMNVTTTGKSVNAIRSFTGKGTLVWGARTLAGNDNEWRYVSVRRFFNMVEESVKKASEQFVFEGNDANTWVRMRAMIENFLTLQWRAGALTGAKPDQAFYVRIGLGQTMTADDILNGYLNVEIGMAVVRPAEFIVLKFSHKMQEA